MKQTWIPTGELRYRTYDYQAEDWLVIETIVVLQQRWKTTVNSDVYKYKWKDVPSVKRKRKD